MEVKKVFSIRTKMIALACLLGLSMVVVVITVWLSLQQNSADAHIIDIAGRQWMLTKKFATEQLYKVVAPLPQRRFRRWRWIIPKRFTFNHSKRSLKAVRPIVISP